MNLGPRFIWPVVHGDMGCEQKSFKLVWQCHHLLSKFLASGHLPRVSLQSRLSVNDKGDNGMVPVDVHRSPGIYLTAEVKPGKPQIEDCQWRLWDQSSAQMGPVPPIAVGRIAQHVRIGRGRDKLYRLIWLRVQNESYPYCKELNTLS